jgi:hypothetical protein
MTDKEKLWKTHMRDEREKINRVNEGESRRYRKVRRRKKGKREQKGDKEEGGEIERKNEIKHGLKREQE